MKWHFSIVFYEQIILPNWDNLLSISEMNVVLLLFLLVLLNYYEKGLWLSKIKSLLALHIDGGDGQSLQSATQRQYQMENGTSLDLVVRSGLIVVPANTIETEEIIRTAAARMIDATTVVMVRETFTNEYVHLFAGENEPLLLRRNALFLFDTLLDPVDFISWLDVNFDFFAGQCLQWVSNR